MTLDFESMTKQEIAELANKIGFSGAIARYKTDEYLILSKEKNISKRQYSNGGTSNTYGVTFVVLSPSKVESGQYDTITDSFDANGNIMFSRYSYTEHREMPEERLKTINSKYQRYLKSKTESESQPANQ